MRKEILLPVVTVAGGIVGFLLRSHELATAFDLETGLPVAGATATTTLIAFSVIMVALIVLLSQGGNKKFKGDYDAAFAAKDNTLYATAGVLAGFLLGCSALFAMWYFVKGYDTSLTKLVLALLCLASCPCVIALVKNNLKEEGRGKYHVALLIPAYTCCMWLVSAYQDRAADPVVLDYVYELLAIVGILLGVYHMASFSFEKAKITSTTAFSLAGVYFAMVTLADPHDPSELLLYGFGVLYLLASTALMRYNVRRWMPTPRGELNLNREVPSDES